MKNIYEIPEKRKFSFKMMFFKKLFYFNLSRLLLLILSKYFNYDTKCYV